MHRPLTAAELEHGEMQLLARETLNACALIGARARRDLFSDFAKEIYLRELLKANSHLSRHEGLALLARFEALHIAMCRQLAFEGDDPGRSDNPRVVIGGNGGPRL